MRRGDIRDWTKAHDSRCNWGWLMGAFGPTISPSDIDFIVERRRHFLVGEIKPDRAALTQGQCILLRELAAVSPQFTIFYLVGEIEKHEIMPQEMLIEGTGQWMPCSREAFHSFCEQWYRHADKVHPGQWALVPWYSANGALLRPAPAAPREQAR